LLTFAEAAEQDEDGGMTADDQATAKQISELEARRYQAMTDADTAVLSELLAPDLVYTHSDASTDTRAGYLDKLVRGDFDYGPLEHPETSILVRGDCALVLGDMRGEVRIGGQLRVLNSKALAVWVRAGDGWQLIAFQPTKYPA
jgi:ketosteroid isomerase-like protein